MILHFNNQNCAYGSNSNGEWLLFADGRLLCWATLRATFDSTSTLNVDWTYPLGFAVPPHIQSIRTDVMDINGFSNNGSGPWVADVYSATQARLHIGRFSGQTNYTSGDFWDIDVLAMGMADQMMRDANADLLHWNEGNILRGSNANGEYVCFPNGVQICWHKGTATQTSTVSLLYEWTYPRAYLSAPKVFAQKGETRDIDPPANAVTGPRQDEKDATMCQLIVSRMSGQDNFGSNDTWLLHMFSIGVAEPNDP